MEIRRLPQGPGRNEHGQRTDDATHAGAGPGEPTQLLSLRSGTKARGGSRHAAARCDPAHCARLALLRAAAHHRRVAPSGMDGESQARPSVDARGQPTVRAQTQVRGHHGLQPQPHDLSEPGARVGADQRKSAVDRRFDLHSPGRGVCVSGRDSGCVLSPGDRLGVGPYAR